MMPCILLRRGVSDAAEEQAAQRHFTVYTLRTQVPAGSLVVGRYACLPFYDELEQDLALLGSSMVNTFAQYRYVADFEYYEDLCDVTFPTWFRYEDVPVSLRQGPFVVKGRTNSRKFEWHTKMFAPDFKAAVRIGSELATDGLLGTQGIVIRQFVPLQTFETSVTGTPITNEWRLFYYRGHRLTHGYYWGNIDDWSPVEAARPAFEAEGLPFADEVARRLVDKVPFVVIDVARTVDGRWMVVELNDGCQAGLNGVLDAEQLYGNLALALRDLR